MSFTTLQLHLRVWAEKIQEALWIPSHHLPEMFDIVLFSLGSKPKTLSLSRNQEWNHTRDRRCPSKISHPWSAVITTAAASSLSNNYMSIASNTAQEPKKSNSRHYESSFGETRKFTEQTTVSPFFVSFLDVASPKSQTRENTRSLGSMA
jgi:hypothetical protein